uniref:Uncharacterized protein n=1 Tax=Physcomitrium patens TaxID=3218 RepID=A0A2K1K7Y7_PHYPA|nr:hypothetical protein PHYPA_011790 [Physcomitrium patens]
MLSIEPEFLLSRSPSSSLACEAVRVKHDAHWGLQIHASGSIEPMISRTSCTVQFDAVGWQA